LDRGHRVIDQLLEARLAPVSLRSADATLVPDEGRDAVLGERVREEAIRPATLAAGSVQEDDGREGPGPEGRRTVPASATEPLWKVISSSWIAAVGEVRRVRWNVPDAPSSWKRPERVSPLRVPSKREVVASPTRDQETRGGS
jgi:hypothetical protein